MHADENNGQNHPSGEKGEELIRVHWFHAAPELVPPARTFKRHLPAEDSRKILSSHIRCSQCADLIAGMNLRELIQPDRDWLDAPSPQRVAWVGMTACAGLAIYGFTVGFWRDPLMGAYVALKFPLLIGLTLICNGLLNGLLGLLLGTGLGFRQSFLALLTSFALASVILGSLAPVTFFIAWNAPPPTASGATKAHAAYLVTHTVLIGFAGITANLHLHRLLAVKAPTPAAATMTLLAWLAGNGFLGAQFSWILRPFFGSPGLKVEFLRPHPLKGNFYESVWKSIDQISGGNGLPVLCIVILLLSAPILHAIHRNHQNTPPP